MFIMYSHCPYLPHQFTVVHIIKEAFNIKLNYIMQIGNLKQLVASRNRIFHRAIRTESIAVTAELRFTDWFHNLLYTLLN